MMRTVSFAEPFGSRLADVCQGPRTSGWRVETTNMPVQVPESYRTYCADHTVRTAVDHILDSKKLGVPADLEWNHLPDFHRAVLSAHQVRCEFAIFLHELWNAVWQPVVNGRGFASKTVAGAQEWGEYNLDTYSIWTLGWFGRVYDIADTNYGFGLGTSADTERVQLSLYLWDGESARTSELGLGECWPNIDDYYLAWSSKELAPIVDGGIEVDRLANAADHALTAIEQFCQPD